MQVTFEYRETMVQIVIIYMKLCLAAKAIYTTDSSWESKR